jgi:tetratricopeptide (TPR) repeat protein
MPEKAPRKPPKKKRPSAPRKAAPAPAPASSADWRELADKAAKKLEELAGKAKPHAEKASEAAKRMAVDLNDGLDGAFGKISEQARDLMAKGQHTRVRIKFRGKQVAELPIAVVAAAEMATFWWFGPLRLVIGHVVGKAVLDVEFVSNADHHVAEGRGHLADGELEKATSEFDKALAMDRRHAGAHLGKGIALKLRGDKAGARAHFERAEEFEPRGEAGREARRHLDNL